MQIDAYTWLVIQRFIPGFFYYEKNKGMLSLNNSSSNFENSRRNRSHMIL
jgi:hypothetical protein